MPNNATMGYKMDLQKYIGLGGCPPRHFDNLTWGRDGVGRFTNYARGKFCNLAGRGEIPFGNHGRKKRTVFIMAKKAGRNSGHTSDQLPKVFIVPTNDESTSCSLRIKEIQDLVAEIIILGTKRGQQNRR